MNKQQRHLAREVVKCQRAVRLVRKFKLRYEDSYLKQQYGLTDLGVRKFGLPWYNYLLASTTEGWWEV